MGLEDHIHYKLNINHCLQVKQSLTLPQSIEGFVFLFGKGLEKPCTSACTEGSSIQSTQP